MRVRAFARYLSDQVAGLTYDPTGTSGNIFCGFMPDEPAVAVMLDGGAGGRPQLTKRPTDLPDVHIIIRGDRHTSDDALAQAVYSELQCLDHTELATGTADELYLIGCTAEQSDPISMGRDARGRPEWSLNFNARVRAITANRS